MEIVGRGFLARTVEVLSGGHPDTVVLAAGVSAGNTESEDEFDREKELIGRVVDRCRGSGKRLVYFSTSSAGMYGNARGVGREDDTARPCTPYGAHKVHGEKLVRDSGVDHLILRLSSPVGPHQPKHQLVPGLVRGILSGRVTVQRFAARDLIGIDDLVVIIDSLLSRGYRNETVNVASGVSVPVESIVEHLENRMGKYSERTYEDSGRNHTISLEKLGKMVPELSAMNFDDNYYKRVLDSYVSSSVFVHQW